MTEQIAYFLVNTYGDRYEKQPITASMLISVYFLAHSHCVGQKYSTVYQPRMTNGACTILETDGEIFDEILVSDHPLSLLDVNGPHNPVSHSVTSEVI